MDPETEPADNYSRRTVMRDVMVRLEIGELAERGRMLAAAMSRRDELDADRKAIAAQIKVVDAEIDQMQVVLDQGQERRPADCTAHFDFDAGTVTITYDGPCGTEVIDRRAMIDSERQGELDLDEGDTDA